MEFVPPTENRAPIRIGFALHDGVMNTVHARRNNYVVQYPFHTNRQSPVGMMKQGRGFECDKEHDQHYRPDSEDGYRKRKKPDRKKHFAEMKSCGRGYIEVKISMVHVMKSPEDWHHVIGPVPPPVGVIHQQKGRDACGPSGQTEPV